MIRSLPRTVRCALLGFAACALAACDRVVFESPPGTTLSDCDERLVGGHRIVDLASPERADADAAWLWVEDGCRRWLIVSEGRDDTGQPAIEVDDLADEARVRFTRFDTRDVLVIDDPRQARDAEADPFDAAYVLMELRPQEDGAYRLYDADPHRTARLVLDDVLPGRVDKRSQGRLRSGQLQVRVDGDAAAIADAIHRFALLDSPRFELQAVDGDRRNWLRQQVAEASAIEEATP